MSCNNAFQSEFHTTPLNPLETTIVDSLEPEMSELEEMTVGSEDDLKVHSCRVCDYKCPGVRHMWDHIIRNHPNTRPHQCPICVYRAKHMGNLNRHIRSIHKKFAMDMGLSYVCKEPNCKLRFKLKRELDNHSEWHLEQINGKSNRDELEHNYLMHDSNSNSNSTEPTQLGELPLKCRRCGYSYKTFRDIRDHIKSHKKSLTKYQCQIGVCTFTTISIDDLKTHKLTNHKNEMTHIDACRECRIRGHVSKTCTLKPFLCVFCRASFTYLDSLRDHYKSFPYCVDNSSDESADTKQDEDDHGNHHSNMTLDSIDPTTSDDDEADDEESDNAKSLDPDPDPKPNPSPNQNPNPNPSPNPSPNPNPNPNEDPLNLDNLANNFSDNQNNQEDQQDQDQEGEQKNKEKEMEDVKFMPPSAQCKKVITNDAMHRCKVPACEFSSNSSRKLVMHRLKQHQMKRIPKEMKSSVCKVCKMRFIFSDNLMVHMIDSHSVEELETANEHLRKKARK